MSVYNYKFKPDELGYKTKLNSNYSTSGSSSIIINAVQSVVPFLGPQVDKNVGQLFSTGKSYVCKQPAYTDSPKSALSIFLNFFKLS